jgi:hypothetical protein
MKKLSIALAVFLKSISAEESFTGRGPFVGDAAVPE